MSQIKLLNEDNVEFLKLSKEYFDFIYCDCIYEDRNLDWVYPAITRLNKNGLIVIQTDYHTVSDYKILLDGFGLTFVNWLIYVNDWGGVPRNRFPQKHDDILIYCNGDKWKWYPDRIQIPKATAGTAFDKKGTGLKTPPSVFYDKASFSTTAKERIKLDNSNIKWQKPLWLMERLLLPFTDENDRVLDLFMGSGTLGQVCKEHNRNYTGIELDEKVFSVAEERINVGVGSIS